MHAYRFFGLLCIASLWAISLKAQNSTEKRTLKVKVFGSTVGEMTLRKTTLDALEIFEVESRVTVGFFMRKTERYNFSRSTYLNGIFKESYLKNEENNLVTDYTAISSQNGQYLIQTDNRRSQCDGPITFTTTRMLFEEPVNVGSKIFSEFRGVYATLNSHEPGRYTVRYPNGDTFYYRYQNGRLVELETPQFIGRVRMVPVE
ncbi:MAG: hypothetical protein N2050_09165 [Flavobacteriales bacterium]|nr:hypothetical protein [Flavobacteriales bacterium]MCX7650707.1 hypothetical protein [Flavobacteriales bacterium]MDW8432174.1 DUF6134 family protein [Flavobacteriales bacterium]